MADQLWGSRDEVMRQQHRYVQYFVGQTDVIDIACGRAEFLELMDREGFTVKGLDVAASAVSECRERGFEAVQDDALSYLETRRDESIGGVFAWHAVENLRGREIVSLVQLVFARLRPGGVLVVEAMNPTALVTYASFYRDFRFERPVDPTALQWLAASVGFDTKIEYFAPVDDERKLRGLPLMRELSPRETKAFNIGISLANELVFGYERYALIARKPA
jgi:O-antigen chain-terminating methyltransferase